MDDTAESGHDAPFSQLSEAASAAQSAGAGALGEIRSGRDTNKDASLKKEWRVETPELKHQDATTDESNEIELEHRQRVRRYADLLVEATRRHTLLPSDMLGKKFRWAAASVAVQTDARLSFSCLLLLGLANFPLSTLLVQVVRPTASPLMFLTGCGVRSVLACRLQRSEERQQRVFGTRAVRSCTYMILIFIMPLVDWGLRAVRKPEC